MEKISNIFNMGGPMMIPLFMLSFVAVIIFIERLLYLHKGQIKPDEFVSGIKTALKNKRLLEAITICDESFGPIPRVLKVALLNCEQSNEIMTKSVAVSAQNEFFLLDKRIPSLAMIAKIAPLLGLMGTVVSLLQIFYTMSKSGSYATASEFTMYIYSALLSSAFGLLLSLICWLAYSFLNSKLKSIAHDIDIASNDLILFIIRGMPKNENLHLKGKE